MGLTAVTSSTPGLAEENRNAMAAVCSLRKVRTIASRSARLYGSSTTGCRSPAEGFTLGGIGAPRERGLLDSGYPRCKGESAMITVELEREDKLTIAQWESFLALARQAGAADDTPVEEVMVPRDDEILAGWRVQAAGPAVAAPDSRVSLPACLVHELLSVVSEVATSDGDVRGLEAGARTAMQRAYDHLLMPVLGDNPYDDQAATTSQPEQ
jgi:hypothetical protein